MSEAEGSSNQAQACATQPPFGYKISVTFDIFGSPVGPESTKFSSFVGKCVKTHISVAYESWKSVPKECEDRLWEAITDVYEVPSFRREKVLSRAKVYWREYKSKLRDSKIYKHTRPLQEIKKDNPAYIRIEDWEKFVDHSFTSNALKKRAQAREARAKNISLHITGRRGAARTKYKMEQENPGKKIERTGLFLGIHTNQDGTCVNKKAARKMNRIRKISDSNPSSTSLDIDHDPVANVFGKDTRGSVRGYGASVSRTVLKATQPMIDQLRMQNKSDPLGEQRIRNIARDIFREEFAHHLDLHHLASVTSQMRSVNAHNHSTENVTEEVDLRD